MVGQVGGGVGEGLGAWERKLPTTPTPEATVGRAHKILSVAKVAVCNKHVTQTRPRSRANCKEHSTDMRHKTIATEHA